MGILKLGGIASGLDTDGLIKTLMTLERRPVLQLQTQSDKLATKASAWRDLNQRLLTLQKRLEDLKSIADSAWDGRRATLSDASAATVTTGARAVPGSYTLEVTALAKATVWQSGLMEDGADGAPIGESGKALNLSGRIQIASGPNQGKSFDIKETDSLNDIADRINQNKAELGLSANVVQVNPGDYRLVLTGQTGAASDFTLDDGTLDDGTASTVGAALKLTSPFAQKADTAADAKAKVNGISISSTTNSLVDAIANTTISLLKTTTGPITVTVTKDSAKVTGAVKAFVDQYNSVVDFINQLSSYDPKSKQAGNLFGEDRLNTISQTLRTKLLDTVSGVATEYSSLSLVGMSSDSFKAGERLSGKLGFDQAKLEAALDKNPNAIRDLFNRNEAGGKGLAVRTVEWLDNYTKTGGLLLGQATVLDKAVAQFKARIQVYDEQILPVREERLRSQFTALEKTLSTFQNQGAWLSEQIKGLQANYLRN